MHWIDITLLMAFALFGFHGLRRGLVRSVFDLVAMATAIFVAINWHLVLFNLISGYIKMPEVALKVISFTLVWLICYLLVDLLGALVHKMIKASFFAPLNLLGGLFLGLLKSAVIVAILFQLIFIFPLPRGIQVELQKSWGVRNLIPVISNSYENVFKLLPKDVNKLLSPEKGIVQ